MNMVIILNLCFKIKIQEDPTPPKKKREDEKTTLKYRASVKVFVFHCYKYRSVFLVLDCDIVMT